MRKDRLAQEIKSLALEIGFAAVGFTLPEPPPHLEVYFVWLEKRCHGEMGYMAEPRAVFLRSHPAELLPDCESVIVLAARYVAPPIIPHPQPIPHGERGKRPPSPLEERDEGGLAAHNTIPMPNSDRLPFSQGGGEERFPFPLGKGGRGEALFGRVAAYAWGEDYHSVLRQRMETLVQRIQEKLGHSISYRCFTDSAPILEREFAQRAGLGWIGKNTCLIHPRLGSYLFLAEIFTDLPLPPDKPFLPDRCGNCQRCIQVCPTQCILPDRTLDARRCISYLTIEHKSAIPLELRASLGDWVFGCDLCQQVCPWNRRVSVSPSFPEFLPQPERIWLPLKDIFSLTNLEFKQKFQRSSLLRPKWRGLCRNSAVVLGNLVRTEELSYQAAFDLLSRTLQNHSDSLVRQHLAWGLAQADSVVARRVLQEHTQREVDPLVKDEIEALLGQTNLH